MMKDCQNTYDLYTPMPGYRIVEFITDPHDSAMPNNRVVLAKINSGEIVTMSVSFCAILIGFRPNLRFLKASPANTNQISGSETSADQLMTDAIRRDCRLVSASNAANLLSRKIAWLKYLCAKCKKSQLNDNNNNTINGYNSTKSNGANDQNATNNTCNGNNNDSRYCSIHNNYRTLIASEPQCRLSLRIGEDQSKSIDCKTNPIAVDKFTNECLHMPNRGLYAMGPLVGDNFIRFIGGGALAITTALNKQHR